MKITEEKMQFIELRAKGNSFDKCAEALKKAKSTLIEWQSELEDEIANLKAMELESLYQQFFIYKEGRIRNIAQILQNVNQELHGRSLTEVPTEKLIELQIKLYSKLSDEMIEPKFLNENAREKNQLIRSFG